MSEYAYCAFRPCGCMVAAAVDDMANKKDTAKAVAGWLRDGLRVERKKVALGLEIADCHHGSVIEQLKRMGGSK